MYIAKIRNNLKVQTRKQILMLQIRLQRAPSKLFLQIKVLFPGSLTFCKNQWKGLTAKRLFSSVFVTVLKND